MPYAFDGGIQLDAMDGSHSAQNSQTVRNTALQLGWKYDISKRSSVAVN